MTPDDRAAATLAAALEEQGVESSYIPPNFFEDASAILAALDADYALVPRDGTVIGSALAIQRAEIARLRERIAELEPRKGTAGRI